LSDELETNEYAQIKDQELIKYEQQQEVDDEDFIQNNQRKINCCRRVILKSKMLTNGFKSNTV